MVRSTLSKLSLVTLFVAGVAASSCGGNRGGGGTIRKPKDTGVSDSGNNPNDTGVVGQDAGPDSGVPPPDSGFPPPDSGFPPPDSGFPPPDGGPQPDSGIMTCTINGDCPGGNPFCLGVDPTGVSFIPCPGGGAQCGCFTGCDPYVSVVQSGCGAGQACGRAGTMSPTPGVCGQDNGGGTQGQPCTSMFMGMDYQGDDCNGDQNFLCHGSDSLDITGTCARLCSPSNPALCTSLDSQSQCILIESSTPPLGVCLRPITDLGAACTMAGMCQGGHCSPEIGGQCSHQCGITNTCPQAGGLCVGIAGQLAPLCALECTVGAAGDTLCSGVNPGLICEDVGIAICWPRCTANTDCAAPNPTCNVGTGHCGP